jgi:ABC-type methionine transport system ATPase subunit
VLEIVERVCSRALILREGRVQAELELGEARRQDASKSLESVFRRLAVGPEIEATAAGLAAAMCLA